MVDVGCHQRTVHSRLHLLPWYYLLAIRSRDGRIPYGSLRRRQEILYLDGLHFDGASLLRIICEGVK